MALPLPDFYRPEDVSRLYLERAAQVSAEAQAWVQHQRVRPAAQDRERIVAFGIDVQVAFCTPAVSYTHLTLPTNSRV